MLRLVQIALLLGVCGLAAWEPAGAATSIAKVAGIIFLLILMAVVGPVLGENDYRNFLRKRIRESGADPEDILSGDVVDGQVVSSQVKEREH